MKQNFLFLLAIGLFACNQRADNVQVLQNRVDSLEHKIDYAYKPGFGDFMASIQVHHNKLWFAGQNENWKLADFEIHEITEAIDDIKEYQKGRKESKMVDMVQPPLAKIETAIERKDSALFKKGYTLLTTTCNSCHRETGYEFNVVKIPDNPPFSNQEFKLQNEK